MRILLWLISFFIITMAIPSYAASEELPMNFLLMGDSADTQYNKTNERPERLFNFKTNLERLSVGQMVTFVTGGLLGAYVGSSLVRHVIGRYANNPDRLAFMMMGTMFGAIFSGQWCENGWWPC